MKKRVELQRPPLVSDPNQLHSTIDQVLSGELAGFVIASSMPDAFTRSVDRALQLGLDGDVNSTTMTFDYDDTIVDLDATQRPDPEDWEQYGVTPLHADGEEGDRMLSISQCNMGAYVINILNRGPAIMNDMPIELWDNLHNDSVDLLVDGLVDTSNLQHTMTSLEVESGQTVIFNPSNPHMGVTTRAPRRVNTTFFSQI